MSQNAAIKNADRTQQIRHYCKKPGHYRNQCGLLKKRKKNNKLKTLKLILETKIVVPKTLSQKKQHKRQKETHRKTVTEMKKVKKCLPTL